MKKNHLLSILRMACMLIFVQSILTDCKAATGLKDSVDRKHLTIGTHKLYLGQQGPANAKTTVIFESGAGGTSRDWLKVKRFLPTNIRLISYDRAGSGKSEAGPLPRTMTQEVFELHELIRAAKVKGKIILVGQSIGGLLVRLYNDRYGKNVAGIVLVDPTHESSVLGSMKYGGWVRIREKAMGKPIPEPQINKPISPGYDSTADYMAEEFQKIYLSAKKSPKQLGKTPLIIISAGIRKQPPGTPDEQWKQLREERDQQIRELSDLSSNSKFVLAAKSTHAVQNDEPEVVAQAIKTLIESINDN